MQVVLIDTFIVPEESKPTLLERTRQVQAFLKSLPGFVEGFLYEKTDGQSRLHFMTTAVWENEAAYQAARTVAAAEFQKLGFNPQDTIKKLKVETERPVYRRTP